MKQGFVGRFVSSRGRAAATIAAFIGLSLSAASVSARKIDPAAAPQAWVAYATMVQGKVTDWLRADDETALRLRAYIDAQRPAADRASQPIALRLWIDARGVVTRVAFTPLALKSANTDLRSLLIGRTIGTRPPRRILLPLRLQVQLEPAVRL